LFHFTFIDLQNVGVISAAPCINYPLEYLQLLAEMFSTSWVDEAYILANK